MKEITLEQLAGMCEVLVMSGNGMSYFIHKAEFDDGSPCFDIQDDMGDSHETRLDPELKVEINPEGLVCVVTTWYRPYLYQKINFDN